MTGQILNPFFMSSSVIRCLLLTSYDRNKETKRAIMKEGLLDKESNRILGFSMRQLCGSELKDLKRTRGFKQSLPSVSRFIMSGFRILHLTTVVNSIFPPLRKPLTTLHTLPRL